MPRNAKKSTVTSQVKRPLPGRRVRYRTVLNEYGARGPFKVFIIHGHSDAWRSVKTYIEESLRFECVVLVEQHVGNAILQNIRNAMWRECDCAVAVFSADDVIDDGNRHARPNVLLETGYCYGFFDFRYWEEDDLDPVVLIKEDATQMPSDLGGMVYLGYSRSKANAEGAVGVEQVYSKLGERLENIYLAVGKYFRE
jgi:predicted nucleotide-binding protein